MQRIAVDTGTAGVTASNKGCRKMRAAASSEIERPCLGGMIRPAMEKFFEGPKIATNEDARSSGAWGAHICQALTTARRSWKRQAVWYITTSGRATGSKATLLTRPNFQFPAPRSAQ